MTKWLGGGGVVRLKFFNGKSTTYGVSFDSGMFETFVAHSEADALALCAQQIVSFLACGPEKRAVSESASAPARICIGIHHPIQCAGGDTTSKHTNKTLGGTQAKPNVETKKHTVFSVAEYPKHTRNHSAML